MAEEHEHKEHEHKEEHHEEAKGGLGASFEKHKTLWIIGGVGVAGVLLLFFMNSGGGGSSSQQGTADQGVQPTQDLSQVGAGGSVDTSSLVGTGGMPSWYNPGAAENLDYWPYVIPWPGTKPGTTGSGGSSSSGSGKKHKKKHHGGTGGSTSGSGGSTSGSGSSGGSTHHGGSGGHKKKKVG